MKIVNILDLMTKTELPLHKQAITHVIQFFLWVCKHWEVHKLKERRQNWKLKSYVVANRMDNESHQLGSFCDLNLQKENVIDDKNTSSRSAGAKSSRCQLQFDKHS